MNWTLAMNWNQRALLRLVGGLFALVGLSEDGTVETVPRDVALRVFRLLRPAESATRRLVVVAAFVMAMAGIELPPVVVRSGPVGKMREGQGKRTRPFCLIDPRKPVGPPKRRRRARGQGPRISFLDDNDRTYEDEEAPELSETVDAAGLCGRLLALKAALEDLPKQVKRLRRLQARRKRTGSRITCPMRPGRPPGHRERPTHVVDKVLRECQQLALQALAAPDTS